jgi:hypothetical protein
MFFHIHANACHRRNFIQSVEQDEQVLVVEDSKARMFYGFYDEVLGTLPLGAADCYLFSWSCLISILLCRVIGFLSKRCGRSLAPCLLIKLQDQTTLQPDSCRLHGRLSARSSWQRSTPSGILTLTTFIMLMMP